MKAKLLLSTTAFTAMIAGSCPAALAQTAAPTTEAKTASTDKDLFDIVVTARKREETLQDSPVAVSAFGEVFLDTFNVRSVDDLTTFSPGLLNYERPGYQASGIYLRGIGTSIESTLAEGSVSIVVDGVQVPGFLQRAAGLDLGRIEVLRGPQALFYGKGTPAGVISMVSAAPTDDFELSGNAGYEFSAREAYGEVIAGGGITDTLSGRIAARYSTMQGYFKLRTLVVPGLTSPLPDDRGPDKEDVTIKASLRFAPSDNFDATFTGLHFDQKQRYGSNVQPIYCPTGSRNPSPYPDIFDSVEDCKADDRIVMAPIPQVVLALDPHLKGEPLGVSYNKSNFLVGTVNFRPSDTLTLTSVTGYLHTKSGVGTAYSMLPLPSFSSSMWNRSEQFSEEVRLSSAFEGAINFMIGGFYEYSRIHFDQRVHISAPDGAGGFMLVTGQALGIGQDMLDEDVRQTRDFYSLFGQLILKPVDRIELDLGGRWSHDAKRATYTAPFNAPGASNDLSRSFNNFSPEVTLQYKPNSDVNLFGSYKHGFKSGGLSGTTFQILSYAIGAEDPGNMSYGQEKVKGFEIGSKVTLGRLRINAAAFTYNYQGLQLSSFDPSKLAFRIQNAGAARVKGFESDFNWRPEFVDALTFYGSLAYVRARYTEFLAPCYDGQSISQGCTLNPVAGRFTTQDLKGAQLRGAPEWTSTLGFNYEMPLSSAIGIGFSGDAAYTSGYPVILSNQPHVRQPGTTKLNASVRLFTEDKRWELALIGRNLTDEYVIQDGFSTFDSGAGAVGSTGTAAGAMGDVGGTVMRGREVRLQFSFRL